MKKSCLVYVISPIHAVTSFCAIVARHPADDVTVTVVVQWPGSQLSDELTEIVRTMLRPYSQVRAVISLSPEKLNAILELGERAGVASALRRELSLDHVDEIYYPHDVVGELYQTAATVFPEARRVCFGDGMGFVYERHVRLGYVGSKTDGERESLLGAGKRVAAGLLGRVRSMVSPEKQRLALEQFPPHEAILVLPVDQSGKFLEHVPLTVCPRPEVLRVIERCAEACQPLQEYIGQLLARYQDRPRFLIPTENNAEGGFIDFDREIEMYSAIITKHCEPGSVVFLKSHPAESLPRNERIRERLGAGFEVVQLDNRFRRYPLELWRDLVLASTVICMSSPVLSLRYLFEVDVIQPMDDAFVEHWFPEWTWVSYKNAMLLYREPLQRLAKWDGKSVLYSGTLGSELE